MHAWSEVEHDLMYKPLSGELSDIEKSLLDQINGLVISGEIALTLLQKAMIERVATNNQKFSSQFDLGFFLQSFLSSQETSLSQLSRVDMLLDILRYAELDTPEKLKRIIQKVLEEKRGYPLVDAIIEDVVSKNPDYYSKNTRFYINSRTAINRELLGSEKSLPFLSQFLSVFSEVKLALQTFYDVDFPPMENRKRLPPSIRRILEKASLDIKDKNVINLASNARNKIVHGELDNSIDDDLIRGLAFTMRDIISNYPTSSPKKATHLSNINSILLQNGN